MPILETVRLNYQLTTSFCNEDFIGFSMKHERRYILWPCICHAYFITLKWKNRNEKIAQLKCIHSRLEKVTGYEMWSAQIAVSDHTLAMVPGIGRGHGNTVRTLSRQHDIIRDIRTHQHHHHPSFISGTGETGGILPFSSQAWHRLGTISHKYYLKIIKKQ